MTDFQKKIYNTYLRISRQKMNQPFKLRQDFSDFENSKYYTAILKLEIFFKGYPHINLDDFFSAPFEFYNDNTLYSLDFFNTLKAVQVYRLNEKQKLISDPDKKNQLIFSLESIKYIRQFSKDKNIAFEDYIKHKDVGASTPQFLIDIKNRKVSIYTLLCIEGFEKSLYEFGADFVKFIISEDIFEIIDTMRTKLFNSKQAKTIIKQQINKLTNK